MMSERDERSEIKGKIFFVSFFFLFGVKKSSVENEILYVEYQGWMLPVGFGYYLCSNNI